MIMHIIGLILVITGVIILWGSFFICFAVDIYDDYGIKVLSLIPYAKSPDCSRRGVQFTKNETSS